MLMVMVIKIIVSNSNDISNGNSISRSRQYIASQFFAVQAWMEYRQHRFAERLGEVAAELRGQQCVDVVDDSARIVSEDDSVCVVLEDDSDGSVDDSEVDVDDDSTCGRLHAARTSDQSVAPPVAQAGFPAEDDLTRLEVSGLAISSDIN